MKIFILSITLFLTLTSNAQIFESGGFQLEILGDEELDVPYVNQTQSNWCWAACMAMIVNYYKDSNLTSCTVASDEFNFNCCSNPQPCNKQNSMFRFINMANKYNIGTYAAEGKINWQTIKNQLDNRDPMILRVESKYGGHFIVVFGYYEQFNHTTGTTARMIDFYDPILNYYGDTRIDFHRIELNRLINGFGQMYPMRWTHTMRFH